MMPPGVGTVFAARDRLERTWSIYARMPFGYWKTITHRVTHSFQGVPGER